MPITIAYWHVRVSTVFYTANEMFYPNVDYLVDDPTYNSTLADGRNFKDLCISAVEEDRTFGA